MCREINDPLPTFCCLIKVRPSIYGNPLIQGWQQYLWPAGCNIDELPRRPPDVLKGLPCDERDTLCLPFGKCPLQILQGDMPVPCISKIGDAPQEPPNIRGQPVREQGDKPYKAKDSKVFKISRPRPLFLILFSYPVLSLLSSRGSTFRT